MKKKRKERKKFTPTHQLARLGPDDRFGVA